MIRLNCFFQANPSEEKDLYKAEVSPLIGETGFRRKGPSRRTPLSRFIGRRSVCETWADQASLDAHSATPEFAKYVKEIEACGQLKLEKFEF